MKRKSDIDGTMLLKKTPFHILVKKNRVLAQIRREHASMSARNRRMAAEWEYNEYIVNDILLNSMLRLENMLLQKQFWPSGVVALAIDPLYSPAILTVGSIEYQLGHIQEAMDLFMQLTKFPKSEKDLSIIIDKAGDFLFDEEDYKNALELHSAAEKAFPDEAVYLIGAGFSLAKLGRLEESLEKQRRADALEPGNYKHLNDLGYALLELGKFDEAEEVLKRSLSLSPPDFEFPGNNLIELEKARKNQAAST